MPRCFRGIRRSNKRCLLPETLSRRSFGHITQCLLNGRTSFASYGSTLTTNNSILTTYGHTLTTYSSTLTTYCTFVFPSFQIHHDNIFLFKILIVCSHRIGQAMFK